MIADELKYRILTSLGLVPTVEQSHAISVFADFLCSPESLSIMVLRGSAGTGKTTLAGAIVRALSVLRQKFVLLAPTGRAAKVFSLYAGHPAYTIHRRIYRQKSSAGDAMLGMGGFELNFNNMHDTLFIVDEASMISNDGMGVFGSGNLLDDLIQFVYGGQRCRLLLIGDQAQLPPVGAMESPALQTAVLRSYGMSVSEANLNEVLRQASESGILYNATAIRHASSEGVAADTALPQVRVNGFSDVRVVPGDELIEQLATSYGRVGLDDTIVVTRSNKRANIYNQGIRNTVLDREDQLCRGDRLMIVKNNYYWASVEERGTRNEERDCQQPQPLPPNTPSREYSPSSFLVPPSSKIDFLANGDVAVVQRVRNVHEQHGFHFAEVTMQFPDYDDYELTATVLLDTLTSESPSLTREQQAQLYERVAADYADIPRKADRLKKLKEDPYYNALQVKFAYAVTCHKAQGGQWAHVYVDQGYMTDDMLTPEYLHWLYTAFTRATEQLFLVNWPKTQLSD